MNNKSVDLLALKSVANTLGEFGRDYVFVGGAVLPVYLEEVGEELRETFDIDLVFEVVSYKELTELEEDLTDLGFRRDPYAKVGCRFFMSGLTIDVMSTTDMHWAPGNKWFRQGFENRQSFYIDDCAIKILPVEYFMAAKFDAYSDRGMDPRLSKDFQDIVTLLDLGIKLEKSIGAATKEVKSYLVMQLEKILNSPILREAVDCQWNHDIRQERSKFVMNRIQSIINNEKSNS